jgi:hypothetical protein
MAVSRSGARREFYSTPDIITAANAALSAQGAPLQLEVGGPVPGALAARGMQRVTPVMHVGQGLVRNDQLLDVDQCIEVARQITGSGNLTHAIFRPADGGAPQHHPQNPDSLMGIATYPHLLSQPNMTPETLTRQAQQQDEFYRFVWTNSLGNSISIEEPFEEGEPAPARKAAIPRLINAGMNLVVARQLLSTIIDSNLEYFPALQQKLVDRAQADGILDRDGEDVDKGEIEDGLATIAEAVAHPENEPVGGYENVEGEARQERDNRFGINAAASPEVGEGFGIYSTRRQTQGEQQQAADTGAEEPWTYHFAGVVARDGQDMITLENYNRRMGPAGNAMYYFALYQAGTGESFHDAHKSTVTGALTLVMGQGQG